ncbi:hypothetical protein GSI_02760 [Ganoderma sinense ZZ0214-1]|uniref:Uncharacterized protein n=1 Tax=Ganoderma sinense ZZ0214-1 TaxID=1077348 RepID=A0A2G8SMM2_9APHY|nr:hypothetical protein GSI_02760 [Ganoderma sinense ZZ0214-1]
MSTGFGRELARVVLVAITAARRPEVLSDLVAQYHSDRLLAVKLDFTMPSQKTLIQENMKVKGPHAYPPPQCTTIFSLLSCTQITITELGGLDSRSAAKASRASVHLAYSKPGLNGSIKLGPVREHQTVGWNHEVEHLT